MRELSNEIIIVLIMIAMLSVAANIITTFMAYQEYEQQGVIGAATGGGTIAFAISNPPIFNQTIPDQTWRRYTSLTSVDLDDHFYDPDGDELSYTVSSTQYLNIDISNSTHVVTFDPVGAWWGTSRVTFTAVDPYSMSNYSNIVVLNVTYVEQPTVQGELSVSGGGGGGSSNVAACVEDWKCTDWSNCSTSTSTQSRRCTDLNYCLTDYSKPAEIKDCAVPTCYDNIQNQNETDVDCGGQCSACLTCDDDKQNCHDGSCETDVDCGGPCLPCPVYYVKEVVIRQPPWVHIGVILIAVFLIELYIYRIRRYKKRMVIWRRL